MRTNSTLILIWLLLIARPCHAYLDPGSGSFIIQIIIGVVLSGLVTLKIYFRQLKSFLRRLFKVKPEKHEK
jgi:hypothetical protein